MVFAPEAFITATFDKLKDAQLKSIAPIILSDGVGDEYDIVPDD